MNEKLFRKYAARLKREGIVKSLLCGLIVGAVALTLVALFSWLFAFREGLFVAIAAFVAATASSAALFYFYKFRPTVREVAHRVDALGLEERMITMTELEGDDSYIASMQRADTEHALSSVGTMMLKIILSTSLIVSVAVVSCIGLGMTTVDSLYYAGVIPSGIQLAKQNAVIKNYTLAYTVGEGEGIIYRVEDREFFEMNGPETVEEGQDGSMIYAYAAAGFVFVEWSDGYQLPYRRFTNVKENVSVSAVFESIDDQSPEEPQRQPPSGGGDESGDGDGSPQDPSAGNESQPQPIPGTDEGDSAGGGRDDENNQIVDGKTYYGDQYGGAREDADSRIDGDDNLTDSQKDWINDYLDSIEKNGNWAGGDSGEGSEGGSGEGGTGDGSGQTP